MAGLPSEQKQKEQDRQSFAIATHRHDDNRKVLFLFERSARGISLFYFFERA